MYREKCSNLLRDSFKHQFKLKHCENSVERNGLSDKQKYIIEAKPKNVKSTIKV